MADGQPSAPQGGANDKTMAILACIPALFWLPLVTGAGAYGRYYASQGLGLLCLGFVFGVIGMIPILGWLMMPIFVIFMLVLVVMTMMNAASGKMKPAPLIGSFVANTIKL